ncbi:hypothetical protein MCEMSE18_00283 [Candidatus Planktophila versatilis]|uniref:hypothetical protein n=1 Tax=Candidatus Planktophila versatilis TaxID=1884905 RepID=UPI003BEF025E
MENVDASELPSDKDSTKFFVLSQNPGHLLPFKTVPLKILTPNGQKLVQDFRATKGEFLGGGVMKSDDFEDDAKGNSNALSVRQRVEMQIAFMPKKEQLKMSTQITSEWIAFEYSLVMSITLYGLIISIKWDQIDQIEIAKKGFLGQAHAQLIYRDKKGETQVRKIQSTAMNLTSLKDIATACGVVVKS